MSGQGDQFGVNLGLRFETKYFAASCEGVWSEARWDDDRDSHFAFGIAFTG